MKTREKLNKKKELYQKLLLKKKKKGLDDLYFFNRYILESKEKRRKMIVPHVHGEWAQWLKHSDKRIKMLLVPRMSLKSTFLTVGYTLQQICKDRDTRILIANATLANAQKFLSDVRNHLRNNEMLKTLYGEFYEKNIKWNESEIEVTGRSVGTREPTVTTTGVGGNLVSQHYDIILADDLVNAENSETKYQADKVIDWWKRSLSLLETHGEMIIVGTRWSYYELYSYLLDEFEDRVDFYIRSAYNEDGTMYYPEQFDEEKLKELKDFHGSYFFSAFYLNNPVDEESALIKKSQIKYYKKTPDTLNVFTACDPAFSQETTSDYSAIVTVGVDPAGNWYVLEARRGKWTVQGLIDNLFSVYKTWNPETMSIEVVGQAQSLLNPIRQEEDRRNQYLPMIEIKARAHQAKETRIRAALQARFENGRVFIRESHEELEQELLHFPRSKHDDLIDSLADIEEMEYRPEGSAPQPEQHSKIESRLQAQFSKKKKQVDPVLGVYY